MKSKFFFFLFFFFFITITGIIAINNYKYDPDNVINNLYNSIEIAKENGDYNCCINPSCTMCYLGHWKFEKGTCFCDDAIKEGNFDDVCPECQAGLEKGICNSIKENSEEESCEI